MKIRVTQIVDELSDPDDRIFMPAGPHGKGSFLYWPVRGIETVSEKELLDGFHGAIPIGCLDDFRVEVEEDPDYDAELKKAMTGLQMESYEDIRKTLSGFMLTWYLDLFRVMVTAAIKKRVFLPGKIHVFVKSVEEAVAKEKGDGEAEEGTDSA